MEIGQNVELVIKFNAAGLVAGGRRASLVAAIEALGVHLELNDAVRGLVAADDYQVALVKGEVAERVIDSVRRLDGVESAYIKSRGDVPR